MNTQAIFWLFLSLASGYRSGSLERTGNEPLQSTARAFAMRRSDGSVVAWGNASFGGDSSAAQPRLKNVKSLCGTCDMRWGAFAAVVGDDNAVVCWGDPDHGGDCSAAVANQLKEVEGICGAAGAFAALKRDGTVISWGDKGGDSSSVQSRLKGVRAIYSTHFAFAAVLEDGTVEAWGDQAYGGAISPSVKARLQQVQFLRGTYGAFAALLSDGRVETWGNQGWGGDSSKVASELTEVVLICASEDAFAALRKDGTVVCWGGSGGDCSQVRGGLQHVVVIAATSFAFAAARSDGRVLTWGSTAYGGDSSSVAAELKEVVAIRGTAYAFAALRKDGTVISWGHPDWGGDSSAVQSELKRVVGLSSTARAFAARRSEGTVVTWGEKESGGDSSSLIWRMPWWGFALVLASWLCVLRGVKISALTDTRPINWEAIGVIWFVHGLCGVVAAAVQPSWALTPAWMLTGLLSFSIALAASLITKDSRITACLFIGFLLVLWCSEWLLVGIEWTLVFAVASPSWDCALAWALLVSSSAAASLASIHGNFVERTGLFCLLVLLWCCFAGWWHFVFNSFAIVAVVCVVTADPLNGLLVLLERLCVILNATCCWVVFWRVFGGFAGLPGALGLWVVAGLVCVGVLVARLVRRKVGSASASATEAEQGRTKRTPEEETKKAKEKTASEDSKEEEEEEEEDEKDSKQSTRRARTALRDGSVEFWVGQLRGVLDEEDIAEAASKLSAGGFKQKHIGDISEKDLKEIGIKPAVIKDFMKNQRSKFNVLKFKHKLKKLF